MGSAPRGYRSLRYPSTHSCQPHPQHDPRSQLKRLTRCHYIRKQNTQSPCPSRHRERRRWRCFLYKIRIVVVAIVSAAAAVAGRLMHVCAIGHGVVRDRVRLVADICSATAAPPTFSFVTSCENEAPVQAPPWQAGELLVLVAGYVGDHRDAVAVPGVLLIPRFALCLFLVLPRLSPCGAC